MERRKILEILKDTISKNNIEKAYLFGSFARGEAKYNDIDIIIEPPKDFSLLDLSRMANTIEEKLGKRIDIITLRSINPKLKRVIKKEMVAI